MSRRIKHITIIFQEPISEEKSNEIMNGLRHIEGVAEVNDEEMTLADYSVRSMVRHELGGQLWNILYPKDKK